MSVGLCPSSSPRLFHHERHHRLFEVTLGTPALVVQKPGVSYRFFVDNRKLNSVTRVDPYSLPNIQEALSQLGIVQYFSVIGSAMRLAQLSLKHNLTRACINNNATLPRSCGLEVPADARTILRTQRKAPVEQDGTFVHSGLQSGTSECIQGRTAPTEVRLQANIDGLPLYKSSSTCFWPMLCTNHGIRKPFLVSLYCGRGKPPDPNAFLAPFLQDVEHLTASGIQFKGRHVNVKLDAIICDAVARSFLKCTKSHDGYYGCERCVQKGVHQESRLRFMELDAPLHTNASFREQRCQGHHAGESQFLRLDIDTTSMFPHRLCAPPLFRSDA